MATGGVSAPDPLPLATTAADRAALGTDVTQSWLPQYFTDVLSVELKDVGIFAVMPYLAGVVFDNVWAVLIDHLIARGTLSTLGARKFSQVVAFAAPSLCIGVLLGLGERVTPVLASALFSAALGINMASHSGYWANLIDIAPTKAGFALGVSNTIGNIPGMPPEEVFWLVSAHLLTRTRRYLRQHPDGLCAGVLRLMVCGLRHRHRALGGWPGHLHGVGIC